MFHGGTTVMKRGKTENIKKLYLALLEETKSKGLNILLSGPFPNPCMSSETFSRTAHINCWLNNIKGQNHLSLVSNFSSFWNNDGMIYPYSYKLTEKGAAQFTSNIQRCLL